jgi:hypothetical protein
MKTKKRKKKRIGISLILAAAVLVPLAAYPKKKAALESYAVISGNVFNESAFALPDATATLTADPAPAKPEKMEAVSDSRGEFVFRVPPTAMRYTIVVAAKGYKSMQKSVSVEGEERLEVTFQLERESK